VHELHYPVEPNLRGIFIGIPTVIQFAGMALVSDHLFFSHRVPMEQWNRRLPYKRSKFSWLPVGANIEPVPDQKMSSPDVKKMAQIKSSRKIIIHFGGSHLSHGFLHMFHSFEEARKIFVGDDPVLLFVGMTQHEVDQKLGETGMSHIKENVIGIGYLGPEEASCWLAAADLVLAPFLDGVSTRRGSMMAAFTHGKAMVTTSGRNTDPLLPWNSFCSIVSVDDVDGFKKEVIRLLGNQRSAEELGVCAKKYYDCHFSWPVIARNLIGVLSTLREKRYG
ncbi:MAG: glycosyltransferase, partial [Bdellovibrionota bacterium]